MSRLRDLTSGLPSSYNPSSMWLWTHDGAADYKISVAQLRYAFSEVGAMWHEDTGIGLSATPQKLSMGSLYYDVGSFTNTASVGAFYIFDDRWSHVRLKASFECSNAAYGYEMEIYRNGARDPTKWQSYYDEFNAPHGGNLVTGFMEVNSGDYFEVWNTDEQVNPGSLLASNASWFAIQPVRMK